MNMEMTTIQPMMLLDYVDLLVAIVSLIMLYGLKNSIQGRVGIAINFIILGILFQAVALVWTIVFVNLGIYPNAPSEPHHLFMTLGMISFVFAAHKFSLVNQHQ